METGTALILIAVVLIGLFLLVAAFIGAVALFALAAEQGFIGMAAYVACWVFFFPVMLGICIIFGLIAMLSN